MDDSSRRSGGGRDADERGFVRARFDWAETPPWEAVVRTVAIAADRGPLDLDPLHASVDTGALDAAVRSLAGSHDGGRGYVTVRCCGRTVAVHGNGEVIAWPVSRRGSADG